MMTVHHPSYRFPQMMVVFVTILLVSILSNNIKLVDGTTTTATNSKCERLKTSLTYSQENAPKDISGVLPLIVEKINRELEGVVDVEVLFTGGDIHRRVGEHTIQCSVTRLLSAMTTTTTSTSNETTDNNTIESYETKQVDEQGRNVITQCFLVPFTITDVDECTVPVGHPMRHVCPYPALCVNTPGSYECLCPLLSEMEDSILSGDKARITSIKNSSNISKEDETSFWKKINTQKRSAWELSFHSSSDSSCPGLPSTHSCCDSDAHDKDGLNCRSRFKCPVDPCLLPSKSNDCTKAATCNRSDSPLDKVQYTCTCPVGLMGNGHECRMGIDLPPKPMVMYDGITPTDETVKQGFYCGCTKPVIDPCAGFPKCEGKNEGCTVAQNGKPICACKPGYVKVENFGCVDESRLNLKLKHDVKGDGITRLKQGDSYKEYGVDVIDENAEDYLRSLKIAYSRPLPPGCLVDMGSFHVNYTIATPWTSPPYARVRREVVIDDIDECTLDVEKYETQCPALIPQCDTDAGALCANTKGSYTCKCPKYTSGDGFKFISSVKVDAHGKFIDSPVGYKGGTGCRDTSKPIIEILGPNPKIFRTCKCEGLSGIMKITKDQKHGTSESQSLVGNHRGGYEADIKRMIKLTEGAELCATHTMRNPRPSQCVRATDHTYRGSIDLSSKVTVGEPIQKSAFEWKVPYNVMDDAGNVANTVWRDIVVEEVDLSEFEAKIRNDILADKENEIQEAVRIALQKERSQNTVKSSTISQSGSPSCPKCECRKDTKCLSMQDCESMCDAKMKHVKTDGTCTNVNSRNLTFVDRFMDIVLDLVEGILSARVGLIVTFVIVSVLLLLIQRYSILSNRGGWYYFSPEDEQKEREMLDAVTYFRSPEHAARSSNRANTMQQPQNGVRQNQGPPVTSMSVHGSGMAQVGTRSGASAVGGGIFTPPQNRVYRGRQPPDAGNEDTSIYQNMSPITPGRRSY